MMLSRAKLFLKREFARLKGCSVGCGVILGRGIVIAKGVRLGNRAHIENSILDTFSSIECDAVVANSKIGAFSYVAAGSHVAVSDVGPFCSIGPGVKMGLGEHPINIMSTHPVFYSKHGVGGVSFVSDDFFQAMKRVALGADVWIGAGAYVRNGVTLGVGSVVAAGAVVVHDVPPYAVVGGVPARIIKYRFSEEIITRMVASHWWDCPIDILREHAALFRNDDVRDSLTFFETIRSDQPK